MQSCQNRRGSPWPHNCRWPRQRSNFPGWRLVLQAYSQHREKEGIDLENLGMKLSLFISLKNVFLSLSCSKKDLLWLVETQRHNSEAGEKKIKIGIRLWKSLRLTLECVLMGHKFDDFFFPARREKPEIDKAVFTVRGTDAQRKRSTDLCSSEKQTIRGGGLVQRTTEEDRPCTPVSMEISRKRLPAAWQASPNGPAAVVGWLFGSEIS